MKELFCFMSANIFSIIDSKTTNNGAKKTNASPEKIKDSCNWHICN